MTTSPVFYELLLPSGRAVRFTPLKTRDKLLIEKRVAENKGDAMATQIQTVATCLKAYTEPLALRFKVDKDGQPTAEVDVDAMLDALPAGAWRPVTFLDLTVEGPTHCLELFESLPDWAVLWGAIAANSGWGDANESLLTGKARMGSSAR